MSRVIDVLPGRVRYPWREWMDGQAREIVRGEDFEVTVTSMVQMIRQRGARLAVPVETRISGDSVLFQFTRPEET